MSSTRAVREAILGRLVTITAGQPRGGVVDADPYVHTLSGRDQVLGGKHKVPPGVVPFACIWTIEVEDAIGPPLGSREQTGHFGILAWAAGSPKHPAHRQDVAEDLLDDIRAALRADPKLGGAVLRFTASGAPWQDEQDQTTGPARFGVVFVAVTAWWRER